MSENEVYFSMYLAYAPPIDPLMYVVLCNRFEGFL